MIIINSVDLGPLITSYAVHKEDVIAGAGTSETGVSWDQRSRAGKATVKAGLSLTDAELAVLGGLIAPATFSMSYFCRGSQLTGTFKVRASDEVYTVEDNWEVEITFKEL